MCLCGLHIHVQNQKEKLKDKHIICYVVSFMKPKYGTEKLRFSNILCLNDVSSSQ